MSLKTWPQDCVSMCLKKPSSAAKLSCRPEKAHADLPLSVPSGFFRLLPFPVISPATAALAAKDKSEAAHAATVRRVLLLRFIMLTPVSLRRTRRNHMEVPARGQGALDSAPFPNNSIAVAVTWLVS